MKPPLSIGIFGRFGRSASLRALDTALRAVDLHPNLVPEAVKLTTVRMLIDETGREDPGAEATHAAAEIVAYCLIGADAFAGANGTVLTREVERRIDAALASGISLAPGWSCSHFTHA
ncbi:hypothetical protein [Methyloceanibacter superfactus]|uniref:hypothetical protein n=1 Tax=Methyloceanibacter superfactus TaxID=1774969 RepID=UPI001FCE0144|nr:hypothetical protein [Methyloceanibacter superfactus]